MHQRYPVYFLQTNSWLDFWKGANGQGHDYFEINVSNLFNLQSSNAKIILSAFVYIYPWQLRQKFWYIPKSPITKLEIDGKTHSIYDYFDQISDQAKLGLVEQIEVLFQKLITQITSKAKSESATFVKIDFDDSFADLLNLKTNSEILKKIESTHSNSIISNKTIQYLQAMVLELDQNEIDLKVETGFSSSVLSQFFVNTRQFWSRTNENVRRYTKKSLQSGWNISTDKTDENFEAFWQVYQSTSDRQQFFTHHKNVVQNLMGYDFSRIIILRDQNNQPQSVWMGIVSDSTLTYLYGGNTPDSFKNYGQYLLHLVALKMTSDEGLQYYDLGRYDPEKSYSKFKENYHGTIRNFLGPIDLIISPAKYYSINLLIRVIKFLKFK